MKTSTYSFGMSKREGHDSSGFYKRALYQSKFPGLIIDGELSADCNRTENAALPFEEWVNKIYHHTSEDMFHIPDSSVALAFTSPPYNSGKDYDENFDLRDYLGLISRVGKEVHRVLRPGGRYIINVANLGRKPYIPMHAYFYSVHTDMGFLPSGEIIWRKGKSASGNCAWGSWKSAKSPTLRDVHEYLLVFSKEKFVRPDKGLSDIEGDEFMESTISVWDINPESAKKVGHPAPFPAKLASRVIKLYSFVDDCVLDPFVGSGTTCIAAKLNKRYYAGYDIKSEYCALSRMRLSEILDLRAGGQSPTVER